MKIKNSICKYFPNLQAQVSPCSIQLTQAMPSTLMKIFILSLLHLLPHNLHKPPPPPTTRPPNSITSEFKLIQAVITNSYHGLIHNLTFQYIGLDDDHDKTTTLSPNTTTDPPRQPSVKLEFKTDFSLVKSLFPFYICTQFN